MKVLKPPKPKTSKVALIAPSGRITADDFNLALENMRKIDLSPIFFQNLYGNYGHHSAPLFFRLFEFMAFFDWQITDLIFAIRGGSGATELLPHIDYEQISKHPKIFAGFSDITSLQSVLWVKIGLVTFHGYHAKTKPSAYVKQQLNNLIFNPVENYRLPCLSFDVLKHGRATGRIVGGNLALLEALTGTQYLFSFKNNIVFIEEIAEPPYKIDRMFTHLFQASDLSEAAAIVLGQFTNCSPENFKIHKSHTLSLLQIFEKHFCKLDIPVVYNVNFAHIENSLIFPIGVKALLNTHKKEIILLEKAVI